MTSNDPPPTAASGGRRRALGRGPGTASAHDGPEAPAAPERPAPSPPPGGAPPGPQAPRDPSAAGEAVEPGTPDTPGPVPGEPSQAPAAGLVDSPRSPSPARARQAPQPPVKAPVAPSRPAEALRPPPAAAGGARDERREAPRPTPPPDTAGAAGGPVPAVADTGPGAGGAHPAVGATHGASPGTGRASAPGAVPGDAPDDGVFTVRLSNFEGPFDLLLQLISKHKLDVTEVALSTVTDEFMAHIRAMGPDWDLDQTTEFLVVAATLLDLKAARLLPTAEVEDEADLALLEARDLLFARLLQYRAYKRIADIFTARLDEEGRRYPRTVGLEAHHAALLPEVVISIGAEGFARLAVKAMQPKPRPQVYVDHIHAPLVSVQEQAQIVVARLRELGEAGFRALVEDTDDVLTVVARFLALLELYREKAVALDQEEALGELTVRWTGGDGADQPRVTDEFDRPAAEPAEDGDRASGRRREPAAAGAPGDSEAAARGAGTTESGERQT